MRVGLGFTALCLCLVMLSVACSSGPTESIAGVLVEVQASGLTEVESFSVRDADGQAWVFRVSEQTVDEEGRRLTAGHLRQDMAMVEPVQVEFRREGDLLVAIRLSH